MSKGKRRKIRYGRLIIWPTVGMFFATTIAGGFIIINIGRKQVAPECLRSKNCVCREFGVFKGNNNCVEVKP